MSRRSQPDRTLRYGCLGTILLIFLIFLFRPVFLPDAFFLRLIERKIASSTPMRLSVESGRIRFLKSLDLRGVTLADSAGRWRMQMDAFSLHYRLLPIWKKKLVITELQLVHPQIRVFVESPDTAVAEPEPKTAVTSALHPEFSLPISIAILHLIIRDLQLDLSVPTASGELRASSSGLQIEARDLFARNERDFRLNLAIRQEDSLHISRNSPAAFASFTSSSDFSLQAAFAPDSAQAACQWRLSPSLTVNSGGRTTVGAISEIETHAGARLFEYRDIVLDSLALYIEDWLSLQADGKIQNVPETGAITANILFAELDLGKFQTLMQRLFPAQAADKIGFAYPATGKLQISDASATGSLRGATPALGIVIPWSIADLEYSDPDVGYRIREGRIRSVLEARLLPLDSLRFTDEAEFSVARIMVNADGEKPISLNHLTGGFSAGISAGYKEPYLRLHWKAQGPDQASQDGALALRADSLNLDDPASSAGSSAEFTTKLNRLNLRSLMTGDYAGTLDAAVDIQLHRLHNLSAKFSAFPRDVSIPLDTDTLRIPEMNIHATVDGTLRNDFSGLTIQNAELEALPYGSVSFHGSFDNYPEWDFQDIHARFDLSELATQLQVFTSAHEMAVFPSGTIHITGSTRGRMSLDSLQTEQNLTLQGADLAVNLPDAGISADSLSLSLTVSGENLNVSFSEETKIGRLFLKNWREEPLRNLEGGASGLISASPQLRDALFWLESRQLGMDAQAYVNAEFPPNRISFDLETQFTFSAKEPVYPLPDIALAGKCDGSLQARFTPDSALNLKGILRGENLTVDMTNLFQAENLTLQLPFEQTLRITPEGVKIHFENSSPLTLDDPVLFASMLHQFGPKNESGRVRMSSADFGGYKIQNLRGNLFFRQGRFAFPQFSLEAYGGTIFGGGRVDIPELTPDSIRYRLQFALESVNSSLLPGIKSSARGDEAQITAFARFRGQGVRTDGYFDLNGGVDITHIGPRVADNLLKFLDPEETDPSIQAYRGYLNRGWGVKVFSFTISDDFVYASITPSQPPLAKPDMFLVSRLVGLGKSITFGRVPLKFFLSQPTAKQSGF
jgi:hypothetical protein